MKIAAVVILYNPEPSVFDHIRSYGSIVKKVFVFDNTETISSNKFNSHKLADNCRYFSTNKNKGIAAVLNEACKIAIHEGFDWLLTMDQDSFFGPDSLNKYFDCLKIYDKSDDVAMFGVNYEKKEHANSCSPAEKNQLITSGSLVNLKHFESIGGFNEELFIDQVDHEYCYKAKIKNYRIVQFENIHMHHALGETTNRISYKTGKLSARSLHSPLRIYYMVRNAFYIKQRYKQYFRKEIDATFKDLSIRIKNNVLYSDQKIATIKTAITGYRDYRKNKMGKKEN
jgi:rhamnosyltransferase